MVQGQKGLSLINPLWRVAVGNTPFVTNDQVGLPSTLRRLVIQKRLRRIDVTERLVGGRQARCRRDAEPLREDG